ncbi:MAG: hypothetical protein AABY00_01635 [Nanoarchaeota archaeon]
MKELAELKEFTASFFKNLGAITIWNQETLIVKGVPKDFEEFFGKKSPYKLVFNRSEEAQDTELIAKGSFLLKAIALYLEKKGQTTLLKVRALDPKELLRHKIVFNNCEIFSFEKKEKYKLITRFTFLTTFQYLNEKEQKMIPIYLSEGKTIEFDDRRFQFDEGKKEDIEVSGIKEQYVAARERLKELIKPQINEISKILKTKLSKEIERITSHYQRQENEIDKQIQSLTGQRSELEKPESKIDSQIASIRLKRIGEQLQKIAEENLKAKLQKEKEFLFRDEIQKHGLNIDTRLLNTTIIYYPIYQCTMLLKNSEVIGRPLEFFHNAKENTLTPLLCESCNVSLSSLTLCSSGHVVCKGCSLPCKSCIFGSCKLCGFKRCTRCDREYCKKCTKKCGRCFKEFCKTHVVPGKGATRLVCLNCSSGI